MKKIIYLILMVLLCSSVCLAKTVDYTLTWDANTEPDLAGYRVYQSNVSGEYTNMIQEQGLTTTYSGTITEDSDTETTFYFVVTAFDNDGLESDYSNEVSQTIDARTPPDPPKNLSWFNKVISWIKRFFNKGNLRLS